jgi:predicted nucleic acid-binding protein
MDAELIADTNVVSYLFRSSQLGFDYRYLISGQAVGITELSVEELHYGAALNGWGERRRQHLVSFLAGFILVPIHVGIAEVCGHLRAGRRRVGRPIELADAWIAATALWYQIPVVTNDRDLERIPGLNVLTLLDGWEARDSHRCGDYEYFISPPAARRRRDEVPSGEIDPLPAEEAFNAMHAWLRQVRERKLESQTRVSAPQLLENRDADRAE